MPALRDQRQPEAMGWFNRTRGRGLLDAERQAISGALVSRPGQQPWLWLAPCVARAEDPELPPGGLRLHAQGLVHTPAKAYLQWPVGDGAARSLNMPSWLGCDR